MFYPLSAVTGVAIFVFLRDVYRRYKVRQVIKKKGEAARASVKRLQVHVKEKQIDKISKDTILKYTATELQTALQNGTVQAVDVLLAYQTKAIEENLALNFITEPISEAEALAIECDKKKEGTKGLLHGIPVSLKENIGLKGEDATVGLAYLIDKPLPDDCVIVKVLKDQGAVPFVRTNLPQAALSFDCSNPIFGKTLNPYDHSRIPGGSSGGEGAILGSGASIIGIGTDIGGSVRIPSHFSGVVGFKPTTGRLSSKGIQVLSKKQNLALGTPGPMARNVDGAVLMMRALLSPLHFRLDPSVPPLPFQEQIYSDTRRLRIGYYTFDGYIEPVPAVKRAILITKEALEKQGHTLVPFSPPRISYAVSGLYFKALSGDGAEDLQFLNLELTVEFLVYRELSQGKSVVMKIDMSNRTVNNLINQTSYVEVLHVVNWPWRKDDVADPCSGLVVSNSKLPYLLRYMLAKLAGWVSNDKIYEQMIKSTIGCRSVHEWWDLTTDVSKYRDEFLDAWTHQRLDAVVCPLVNFAAPPDGNFEKIFGGALNAPLCNLLNYPVGCVPVTKVSKQDCADMEYYPEDTFFKRNIKKVTKGSEGLPVGVQVMSQQWQDELVLRVMKEIERLISKDQSVN